MSINVIDIIVGIVIIFASIVALIVIKRNNGKCAYCAHYDSCPFRKDK